jgi:NAD-dependent SIR2 family protein deacetylase
MNDEEKVQQAAEAVAAADALLIGAGAGMGVDSGLPDFRGTQGFWRAYPPYAKLGLSFSELANPQWFESDPALAWGFYGHRLNLYRATQPHAGFQILQSWARPRKHGAFVFTSNVDGHFQRAGFDPERVVEIHGSIRWMQCTRRCGTDPFPADRFEIAVDESTMRAVEPFPFCPSCRALARPNVLMFGDWEWAGVRTVLQQQRLQTWLRSVKSDRLVIIECGAGTAVPTVRWFCEAQANSTNASLIRINPRETAAPPGHLGLAMAALAALRAIEQRLTNSRSS